MMRDYSGEELADISRQIISGKLAPTIAHKAKNILMPITGYIELLEAGSAPQKQNEYFKKIESSGQVLQSLLKNLLLFSRASAERAEKEIDTAAIYSLHELIEIIASLFGNYMALAKVRLEKRIGCGDVKISGAPDDIILILSSILLNAIEASPEAGAVRIGAEERDGKLDISIDDDGPGVIEEIRDRIFEPFFTTKKGNLGIGLTVSRFLARRISGDVLLSEKNRFIISLAAER